MKQKPPQTAPGNIPELPPITFEDVDGALRQIPNALPTAFCIGVIYGSVCAPNPVPPSAYLPHVFGPKMELPDLETADRVIAMIRTLHTHLVLMIEDNKPLFLRRKRFETDNAGLMLHASELWRETFGFRKGLSLGTYEEADIPQPVLKPYEEFATAMDDLRRVLRRIAMKRKPYTEKEQEQWHQELVARGGTTARLMRIISHQLYLDRMNRYKAAGTIQIGRNDPCPCGSGKKFKHCCWDKLRPGNIRNN